MSPQGMLHRSMPDKVVEVSEHHGRLRSKRGKRGKCARLSMPFEHAEAKMDSNDMQRTVRRFYRSFEGRARLAAGYGQIVQL